MKWDKSKLKDESDKFLEKLKSGKVTKKSKPISSITPLGAVNYVKNQIVKKGVDLNLISSNTANKLNKIKINTPTGYVKDYIKGKGIEAGKKFAANYIDFKKKTVDLPAIKNDFINNISNIHNSQLKKKKSGRYDA